jgi:hypothetical protein
MGCLGMIIKIRKKSSYILTPMKRFITKCINYLKALHDIMEPDHYEGNFL